MWVASNGLEYTFWVLLHPQTLKQDLSLSLSPWQDQAPHSLSLSHTLSGRRLIRRASPVLFRDFIIQQVWLRTRSSLSYSLSLSLCLSLSLSLFLPDQERKKRSRPTTKRLACVGREIFQVWPSPSPSCLSLSLSLCSLWLRIRPMCVVPVVGNHHHVGSSSGL